MSRTRGGEAAARAVNRQSPRDRWSGDGDQGPGRWGHMPHLAGPDRALAVLAGPVVDMAAWAPGASGSTVSSLARRVARLANWGRAPPAVEVGNGPGA